MKDLEDYFSDDKASKLLRDCSVRSILSLLDLLSIGGDDLNLRVVVSAKGLDPRSYLLS